MSAHWTDFVDASLPEGRYLRWRDVERSVGISRTTAWRLQRTGDFPRPYVISAGRVGYREREVEAWKASRAHRAPGETLPPAPRSFRPAQAEPPPAIPTDLDSEAEGPAPPRSLSAADTSPLVSRRRSRQRGQIDQITFDF